MSSVFPLQYILCHISVSETGKREEKQMTVLLKLELSNICSLVKTKSIFIVSCKYRRKSISASRLPTTRSLWAVRDIYWLLYVYWEKSSSEGWAGKQFSCSLCIFIVLALTLLPFPCVNHCMGLC